MSAGEPPPTPPPPAPPTTTTATDPGQSRRGIDREIGRLALPALGALIAEPLYVLADTAVVGQLGLLQLDGLALATTVLLTLANVFVFLAYGTTAAVSRLLGAGQERQAASQAVQGLWLAFALSMALMVAGLILAPNLLDLLGGSEAVKAQGLIYLRISLLGLPAMFGMLAATGYLRGQQDTRTPLFITLFTALGNLILEVILIFGLDFGIGASALSTVVAQYVGLAMYLSRVVPEARRHGAGLRPTPRAMRSLLKVGGDLIVRTLALRGFFTVATAVAARLGDVELGAHHIAFEITIFMALAMDAVAIAGQALVGRYLGAGDAAAARTVSRRMMGWGVAVGLLAAAAVAVLIPFAPAWFSDDSEVRELTRFLLLIVVAIQPAGALAFVLDGVLIGAGDMRFMAKAMSGLTLALIPALVAVAVLSAGIGWLWLTFGVFMVGRVVVLGRRFLSDDWLITGTEMRH